MKVGVFFPGFPSEAGGAYTFEREIFDSLVGLASESSHEWVIFFGKSGDFVVPTQSMPENISTRVIDQSKTEFGLLRKLFNRLLKELNIQTPFPGSISALQSAACARKIEFIWFATSIYIPVDIPYIATVWDIQHRLQPWFPEVSQNGQWDHREAYYSAYIQRAAYIITPNHAGQDELARFYQIPAERFWLLPHPSPRIEPIPTKEEVDYVLGKYHLQPGYLFYPAQFWAHKNHVNLLLALALLKNQSGSQKHLVLIGSNQGNYEYIREVVKKLGIEDRVHFLGFVPREDLIALYCGAFALTYVSLFGPENLPPLEAFQCGCPVIVSNYSGAIEQLGEAAVYVNALNPAEIASAVMRLEQDADLRHSLVERGFLRSKTYTGKDYVRTVFKICDEFESIRRNWGVE